MLMYKRSFYFGSGPKYKEGLDEMLMHKRSLDFGSEPRYKERLDGPKCKERLD